MSLDYLKSAAGYIPEGLNLDQSLDLIYELLEMNGTKERAEKGTCESQNSKAFFKKYSRFNSIPSTLCAPEKE